MDTEIPQPPYFWPVALLCLLGFALLWWFLLGQSRTARRRTLLRRIAALDAQAPDPLPLDLAGMQQTMAAARRAAELAPQRTRFALYALPWFMFIGDAQADLRGLLAAADETAPDAAPRAGAFWQWRFLRSMIAIAIHPAALADPANPREGARWYRALLELCERRRRLALNGVVVCVSTALLLGDPKAAAAACADLRARVDDVAKHLRLRLPVYLVVTGLERLEGYERVRATLPSEVLEQALGHRVGGAPPGLSAGGRLDALFDELSRRLDALRMALLREQPDAGSKLAVHRFVEQLHALQPGLRAAAERLSEPRGSAALRWRGVYLTAASTGTGGAFAWDLFAHFLPADQPLAHSQTPRAARTT
ncbi:MAG TPA: type VI secretion system protein [Variovorax sp.]